MISFLRSVRIRRLATCRIVMVGVSFAMMGILPSAATAQTWFGSLMGTNEVPANASSATGSVLLSLNGNVLSVSLNWSGLTGGPVVAGHIHCCIATGSNVNVAVGFTGLPSTTSGSYTNMFDLSSLSTYTSSFVSNFGGGTAAGSQAALISGLNSQMAYVNLHNSAYPGGEIRANVVVTPEPASVLMLALGLGVVGVTVRRKRRAS